MATIAVEEESTVSATTDAWYALTLQTSARCVRLEHSATLALFAWVNAQAIT